MIEDGAKMVAGRSPILFSYDEPDGGRGDDRALPASASPLDGIKHPSFAIQAITLPTESS
jgi:hypothetical protein